MCSPHLGVTTHLPVALYGERGTSFLLQTSMKGMVNGQHYWRRSSKTVLSIGMATVVLFPERILSRELNWRVLARADVKHDFFRSFLNFLFLIGRVIFYLFGCLQYTFEDAGTKQKKYKFRGLLLWLVSWLQWRAETCRCVGPTHMKLLDCMPPLPRSPHTLSFNTNFLFSAHLQIEILWMPVATATFIPPSSRQWLVG